MIRLCLLVVLTAIKAENESGFQPMSSNSWNEATYLSYIKNMAMYPQVTPMSRQEFEKTGINRNGKTFEFDSFEQKFNNFDHNQNLNNAQTQHQNAHSFGNLQTAASNFAQEYPLNLGMNTQSMQSSGSAYNPVSVQNFGSASGLYLPNNLHVNQKEPNFGGFMNQNHGIFGGAMQAPEKFQSAIDAYTGTPGANLDFLNLLHEQQKQTQMNRVVYPSASYGSPIPGSYPQPPPQSSAQQEEVLKLMKLLLSKIDAQASTAAPTLETKPEYEYKLKIPKHVPSKSDFSNPEIDAFLAKGKHQSGSNLLKQFDFGPGAEIISYPVKSLANYRQHDQMKAQKYQDDEYDFHMAPMRLHSKPIRFRLPVKQPEKFHHHKNSPNRFQDGFEYPSLTHGGYRKPPHKRNHRNGKSRKPGYRLKVRKA